LGDLSETLTHVRCEAVNARSGDATETFSKYVTWVDDTVGLFRNRLSPADVDRLLLTRRYWHLLGMSGASLAHILGLVHTELDERLADLDRALDDLRQERQRWSREGVYVVADTGCFIEHPAKIEAWDMAETLELGFQVTRLLLPILVVDQLDDLKQSKTPHVRWRARHTLQVLDSLLQDPRGFATLREPILVPFGGTGRSAPRGEVSVEIVFDPPDHVRLPSSDDEIVDRAVAIQILIGQPVRFLTYDTGQSLRARAAGLQVTKLCLPPEGDEPDNAHGATVSRRQPLRDKASKGTQG
jgi:hypothetical protein